MILITAFEPFGGKRVNASAAALREIPDRISDHAVRKTVLPVVFGKAGKIAVDAATDCAFIFLLGEADRTVVTPETTAKNIRSARILDNEGNQPRDEVIAPGAPDYHTTVPVKEIVEQMKREGYEIEVSDDAGSFVCNDTFYLVGTNTSVPVVFIHAPENKSAAGTVQRFIELAVSE